MIHRKTLVTTGLVLALCATSAEILKAQFFGISFDSAIAYSAAKKTVVGGSVGITHPIPFIPNFGYSTLSFEESEEQESTDSSKTVTMNTKIKLQTVNLFYHIPFPVVSMSLGIGYGTLEPTTLVTKTQTSVGTSNDTTELSLPVTETFLHIGLPYFNILEFHIGYHAFATTSLDRNKNNSTFSESSSVSGIDFEKRNYSGGMMTIGIEIAF